MKIEMKFTYNWCWSIKLNTKEPYEVWLLHKPRNYKNVRMKNRYEKQLNNYKKLLEKTNVYYEN